MQHRTPPHTHLKKVKTRAILPPAGRRTTSTLLLSYALHLHEANGGLMSQEYRLRESADKENNMCTTDFKND